MQNLHVVSGREHTSLRADKAPQPPQLLAIVEQITSGFDQLLSLTVGPEAADGTAGDAAVEFDELRAAFEKLEATVAKKALLDAYFAQAAAQADAGRIVGSSKTIQYLMQVLGLSRAMAQGRLDQAALLFDVPNTKIDEEKLAELGIDSKQRLHIREQMKKRDNDTRTAQANSIQEQLEAPVPEHVLAMIRREAKQLLPFALVSPVQIMQEAIVGFRGGRDLRDLRAWLVERIRTANGDVDDRALTRGRAESTRRRGLRFSEPDKYGGVRFSGYLDAKRAAVIKAVIGCGAAPRDESSDSRTLAQRRVDKLADLCLNVDRYRQQRNGGVSSIIVTTTVAELENMTGSTLLTTGTGDQLTPQDLLALGAAAHDFVSLTTPNGSLPLALAKGRRNASLYQKLALATTELTCTHPGCSTYWYECDVHHLDPWIAGGRTDIANMTLLCRAHHTDNNDKHNGHNNMGHAERDPNSGRVGHRYADGRFATNQSVAAERAPGAKLRREKQSANSRATHVKNKEGCQNGDHEYFRIMVG